MKTPALNRARLVDALRSFTSSKGTHRQAADMLEADAKDEARLREALERALDLVRDARSRLEEHENDEDTMRFCVQRLSEHALAALAGGEELE